MDPAVSTTLRWALALLFAGAALHKARDPGAFRAIVADYELLPISFVRAAATGLVLAEAITALLKTREPQDEQTPEFLYGLSAAYARSGDRAEALRYGERARELAIEHGQQDLARAVEQDLSRLR